MIEQFSLWGGLWWWRSAAYLPDGWLACLLWLVNVASSFSRMTIKRQLLAGTNCDGLLQDPGLLTVMGSRRACEVMCVGNGNRS